MLEPCGDDCGQKGERLAMRSRQQERKYGELGDVELEVPYHSFEGGIRNFYFRKVEGQIDAADLAALHRTGDAMITKESAELGLHVSRPSTYFRPLSSSALRMP